MGHAAYEVIDSIYRQSPYKINTDDDGYSLLYLALRTKVGRRFYWNELADMTHYIASDLWLVHPLDFFFNLFILSKKLNPFIWDQYIIIENSFGASPWF